jgi:hypothetical protein
MVNLSHPLVDLCACFTYSTVDPRPQLRSDQHAHRAITMFASASVSCSTHGRHDLDVG